MSNSFVLGIDAGNTKTIAIVARVDGSILGWGRSGCGDMYGTAPEAAFDAMQQATHDALAMAGLASHEVGTVVLSAAGADWPEDFEAIRQGAIVRGIGASPIVCNDAIGGLRAGSPDGTGVVIVCGTGTATGARSADGRIWHSSFWQYPHGADQLGRRALQTIVLAELGIAPPTGLTDAVLRQLGQPTVEAALHALTARDRPAQTQVKSLARALFAAAESGDAAARDMLIEHGRALGDMALAAARKVGIEREAFHLVLTGGVLRHPSPLMRDAIAERVREVAANAQPISSAFEPAIGTVMLALEAAAIDVTDGVKSRLRDTAPQAVLFET